MNHSKSFFFLSNSLRSFYQHLLGIHSLEIWTCIQINHTLIVAMYVMTQIVTKFFTKISLNVFSLDSTSQHENIWTDNVACIESQ